MKTWWGSYASAFDSWELHEPSFLTGGHNNLKMQEIQHVWSMEWHRPDENKQERRHQAKTSKHPIISVKYKIRSTFNRRSSHHYVLLLLQTGSIETTSFNYYFLFRKKKLLLLLLPIKRGQILKNVYTSFKLAKMMILYQRFVTNRSMSMSKHAHPSFKLENLSRGLSYSLYSLVCIGSHIVGVLCELRS